MPSCFELLVVEGYSLSHRFFIKVYAFDDRFVYFGQMLGGVYVGMFGAVSSVAPAAAAPSVPVGTATGASSAQPAPLSSGKEKMEPRFLAHSRGAGVPDDILNKLGTAGVTTSWRVLVGWYLGVWWKDCQQSALEGQPVARNIYS